MIRRSFHNHRAVVRGSHIGGVFGGGGGLIIDGESSCHLASTRRAINGDGAVGCGILHIIAISGVGEPRHIGIKVADIDGEVAAMDARIEGGDILKEAIQVNAVMQVFPSQLTATGAGEGIAGERA